MPDLREVCTPTSEGSADALVLFGAMGDLAHKKTFPALYNMMRHKGLDLPVIGVARAGRTSEHLRERARDSIKQLKGAVDEAALNKLLSLLEYVGGDYQDPATFALLKKTLGPAKRPAHYLAIPPNLFTTVVASLAKASCL